VRDVPPLLPSASLTLSPLLFSLVQRKSAFRPLKSLAYCQNLNPLPCPPDFSPSPQSLTRIPEDHVQDGIALDVLLLRQQGRVRHIPCLCDFEVTAK